MRTRREEDGTGGGWDEEDATKKTRRRGRDKEDARGGKKDERTRRSYAAHATMVGEGGGTKGRQRRNMGETTECDGMQNLTEVE